MGLHFPWMHWHRSHLGPQNFSLHWHLPCIWSHGELLQGHWLWHDRPHQPGWQMHLPVFGSHWELVLQ